MELDMTQESDRDLQANNTSGGGHLGGSKFGQAPEATETNKPKPDDKKRSMATETAEHEVEMADARKKAAVDNGNYQPSPLRTPD
jgi:hypothetical protein